MAGWASAGATYPRCHARVRALTISTSAATSEPVAVLACARAWPGRLASLVSPLRYGARKLGSRRDHIAAHARLLVDERVFERKRSASGGPDLVEQEVAIAVQLRIGKQGEADPNHGEHE